MIKQLFEQNINDKKKAEAAYFVFSVVGAYLVWKLCSFVLETMEPQWWISFQNGIAYLLISVAVYLTDLFFFLTATFLAGIFSVKHVRYLCG